MTDYKKNFIIALLSYAVQRDIGAEELCLHAGVDPAVMQRGRNVEVSARQLDDLWKSAMELSGDRLFGLHFGEVMQLSAMGIIGEIIRNSLTIGDALQHCAAFTHVLTDLFDMTVSHQGKKFSIRLLPFRDKMKSYPVMQQQNLELSLAFILHELDGLLLTKMRPESVVLPFAERDRDEYERVLRCTNLRSANEYVMEFSGVLWEEPIAMANYELQRVLLEHAQRYLTTAENGNSIKLTVSNLLKRNTYLGTPSIQEMAANLNISARSLQRKLQAAGVTYQELAESVKRSLALYYLDNGYHQVKEISYNLGYKDITAFTRAFKKWTGKTPSEYKKSPSLN